MVRLHGVIQPEQIAIGKQILEDEDETVEFFEGVPQTLLALKRAGFLLGIVTDTANSISTKLNWFDQGGFVHVWDSIISSNELGTRKPDPAMYHAAMDQLGVNPCNTLFVGHKESELKGAREVGMKTVAFNFDPDAKADVFIRSFPDLLKVPYLCNAESKI